MSVPKLTGLACPRLSAAATYCGASASCHRPSAVAATSTAITPHNIRTYFPMGVPPYLTTAYPPGTDKNADHAPIFLMIASSYPIYCIM